MKKIILILMLALVLTACAQQEPSPGAATSSAGEPEAPRIHEDGREFRPPDGQQRAIDAYQEIMDFFVIPCSPEDPDYPGYPDDFADAYIGEDHYLYVCLTDTDGPEKMKYMRAVKEPQIIKFVEVEHSYNDLCALQMALAKMEGLEFSAIGIDVLENEVNLGIPDIAKEAEVWEAMEAGLPPEIRERFQELPVSIEEIGYITFG